MAIRFRCQHCSGLMSIANRKAGAMVPCATCGESTLVPLEDIFDAAAKADAVAEPPADRLPPSPPPPIAPFTPPPAELPPQPAVEQPREEGDSHLLSHDEIESPDSEDDNSNLNEDGLNEDNLDEDRSDEGESGENRAEADDATSETGEDDDEAPAPALTLHRKKRIDDEMDLTPMVDVTFQLLIFFMVTASFAMQKSIQVPTPDPEQKGATQQMQTLEDLQGTSILVRIDAANSILIDDEPLADPSQLTEILRDKMRKEQKTELLLTAHTAALHRGVIAVIDAANEVGMQKIRLASRKGKDD